MSDDPYLKQGFRKLTTNERKHCMKILSQGTMFCEIQDENLRPIVDEMYSKVLKEGDVLIKQGERTEMCYVAAKGELQRTRMEDEHFHVIQEVGKEVFSSLHVLNRDNSFSTITCVTDECTIYSLSSATLNKHIDENPKLAKEIIHGLSKEVRKNIAHRKTPLLEQKSVHTKHPLLVTSVAAAFESFYRSAMNTALNYRLQGKVIPSFQALFPNMHQQLPIRVCYINGFKGIRLYLDENVDVRNYSHPYLMRIFMAFTPGLVMTPVSSLLEASNVNQNPEPLLTKWRRGLIPRTLREVIFGIGLNQMSDYFEERYPFIANEQLRNAAGSLSAGILCGYLTHLMHNLSALKLMNPKVSYAVHFSNLQQKWITRLETGSGFYQLINPSQHMQVSKILTVVAPIGVFVRTSQIVGSFIILNGMINFLKSY